jgi:hypothetical protein
MEDLVCFFIFEGLVKRFETSLGSGRRLSFLQKTVAECQYFSCNFSNFYGNADASPARLYRLVRSVGSSSAIAKTCTSRPAESLLLQTDQASVRDAISLSARFRGVYPPQAGNSRVFLASSRPKRALIVTDRSCGTQRCLARSPRDGLQDNQRN